MHLRYIHLLRGAAILLVVMVHCVQALEWPAGDRTRELMNVILWDGSAVFFMVAGYLFHHLSPRFEIRDYLWRKFTFVVVPFLLISIPGIVYTLAKSDIASSHPELADAPSWMHVAFLLAYPGEQYNFPLWFIPVMATYFLMAPIFIWLFRRPRLFLAALGAVSLYALWHFRPPITKYQHIDLTVYFVSSYMIGMASSMYREKIAAWLDRRHLILWAAWVGIVLVQFAALGDGSAQRFEISQARTDVALNIYFVQKTVLFFAGIALFRRIQHRPLVALDKLATWSFAIFFLHGYILKAVFESGYGIELTGSIVNTLIVTVVVTGGSLALGLLTRRVIGSRSRYVVGA